MTVVKIVFLTRGSLNHLITFQHLATVCFGGETQCLLGCMCTQIQTGHFFGLLVLSMVLTWLCVRSIPVSKGDLGNGEERLELLRLCLQGAVGRICKVTICSQTLPGQITAGRAQDAAAAFAGNVRLL